MTESSERPEQHNEAADGKGSAQYRRFDPRRIWRWHKYLGDIERFTLWVALATVLLVILGAFQFRAFIESERAFLSIQDLVLATGEPVADQKLVFLLMVHNSGKHVARVKEINISMLVGKFVKELPDVRQYHPIGHASALPVIAPEETRPAVIRIFNTIPREDADNIASGAYPIFVYGYVTYDTGFNLLFPATTGFCYSYSAPPMRILGMFDACNQQAYTYAN
jgi:hypothetical protein